MARFDQSKIFSSSNFSVKCPVTRHAAGDSITDIKQETFSACCYCFKFYQSDPLKIINILPRTVWQPGEWIPVSVQIENLSDVAVKRVKMKIIEEFTFKQIR